MPEQTMAIIGIGPQSSVFTAELASEIAAGPNDHGVIAIGVYDGNTKSGNRAQRRIRQKRLPTIVVAQDEHVSPSLRRQNDIWQLARQLISKNPDILLCVVDADWLFDCKVDLQTLKRSIRGTAITLVCYTGENFREVNRESPGETARSVLRFLFENAVIDRVFVIKTNSPLSKSAPKSQDKLVAKSLAGILLAPLYESEPQNPSFEQQMKSLDSTKFLALAVGSRGVVMRTAGFLGAILYYSLHRIRWFAKSDDVAKCIKYLMDSVMQNAPAMTTFEPFDQNTISTLPIRLNVIMPFPLRGQRYNDIIQSVPRQFEKRYNIRGDISYVKGTGIWGYLRKSPIFGSFIGRFYCQVGVVYNIAINIDDD
jgi:hypothetical protein